MEYKISDICNNLSIGKSTIYERIKILKNDIPETDWKKNDYFYYEGRKLFITEKGYNFIKDNNKNLNNNNRQTSTNEISNIYQNQIIDLYKQRIEYLESENERLLNIIALKEQRELAKDVKTLSSNENGSFFSKIIDKFKFK